MQLRKMTWVLAALSAMAVMAACGGTGRTDLTCSTDADCLGTELCHPGAKVCAQKCTAGTDCPNSAKTCGAISSSDMRMVCQCSTDALCAQDNRVSGTTLTCSTAYSVCAPAGSASAKCTKDSDCSAGQTCDTASGACKAAASGCTKDSDCAAGQTCDTASGACMNTTVGQACSGESQSTCEYGQYCSSSKCAAAPVAAPSCQNFSSSYPAWGPSTNNGPVIYSVTGTYQTNSTYCQSDAPDAFLIKVRAYRTDADWPSARSGVAGFFYLTTDSTKIDVINKGLLVPTTGYNVTTSNKRDAEFNLYLCRPSGSQTIQTGFYFTGGNPICSQINR